MMGAPFVGAGVWCPPSGVDGHTSQICSWDGGTFSDVKLFVNQGGPMLSTFSRKAEVTFHCLVYLDIASYVNCL